MSDPVLDNFLQGLLLSTAGERSIVSGLLMALNEMWARP